MRTNTTPAAERFFCYDPDNGINFYATEAEAREAAQSVVDTFRDIAADDGWQDEVEEVCWGVVRQRAKLLEIPGVLVETDEGMQPAADAELEDVK